MTKYINRDEVFAILHGEIDNDAIEHLPSKTEEDFFDEFRKDEVIEEMPPWIEQDILMRDKLIDYKDRVEGIRMDEAYEIGVYCDKNEEMDCINNEIARIDRRLGEYYAEEVCGSTKGRSSTMIMKTCPAMSGDVR